MVSALPSIFPGYAHFFRRLAPVLGRNKRDIRSGNFRQFACIHLCGSMRIVESRSTAIAVRTEPLRAWTAELWQNTADLVTPVGEWAAATAQKFGALVSALMGPAVFSAYMVAVWSLAAGLGWTDTFLFASGPLSNWFLWLGLAILLHLAANILQRHTRAN